MNPSDLFAFHIVPVKSVNLMDWQNGFMASKWLILIHNSSRTIIKSKFTLSVEQIGKCCKHQQVFLSSKTLDLTLYLSNNQCLARYSKKVFITYSKSNALLCNYAWDALSHCTLRFTGQTPLSCLFITLWLYGRAVQFIWRVYHKRSC